MAKVATQFSADDDIATLYAEAVMDLSPWNYWKAGGREPNPQSVPIVPTLERVLARNPNHPGAIHLYIHAVEASDRPKRAEPYADRLRGAIPGAGHLVHMPSHIYYRVGRYLDALEDNKTAVKVDEKYLADTKAPMGVYRLGYYPHNVHFVMASAQLAGDGQTVIAAAEKLRELIPDEAARGIAMVQPVKAAPYFAHAQFSAPETILALPDPGDAIPYVKAMWLYARGVALAARGDFAGAGKAADAIETLERTADFKLLNDSNVPAQEVLRIAQTLILARIAQARGDTGPPSCGLSERPRCRTRCPTLSRRIGITRSGSLLPLPCCRLAATLRRSDSSSARSAERHPTVGRTSDWSNCIRHAATLLRRARPRLALPEPGLATASCCRFPISEIGALGIVKATECPLWVKSGHVQCKTSCPLWCQKRTRSCGAWDPCIDFISQQSEINRLGQ